MHWITITESRNVPNSLLRCLAAVVHLTFLAFYVHIHNCNNHTPWLNLKTSSSHTGEHTLTTFKNQSGTVTVLNPGEVIVTMQTVIHTLTQCIPILSHTLTFHFCRNVDTEKRLQRACISKTAHFILWAVIKGDHHDQAVCCTLQVPEQLQEMLLLYQQSDTADSGNRVNKRLQLLPKISFGFHLHS